MNSPIGDPDWLGLIPYFPCQSHIPPPPVEGNGPHPCHACGATHGQAPEGSNRVCMSCHAVDPRINKMLGISRKRAIDRGQPDREMVARAAQRARERRRNPDKRSDHVLTKLERLLLVQEFSDCPEVVTRWLESVGQPVTRTTAKRAWEEDRGVGLYDTRSKVTQSTRRQIALLGARHPNNTDARLRERLRRATGKIVSIGVIRIYRFGAY